MTKEPILDAKRRELKPGDKVLIPATVTDVGNSATFGNITLKGLFQRHDGVVETFRLNSAQILRAEKGDANGEFFLMPDTAPKPEEEADVRETDKR
jgi:hypothetical protein